MPRLLDVFLWLDGSVARYWTVAWSLFVLWFVSALVPYEARQRWRRWNHPAVFAGLMLLILVAFRWPGIGQNFELVNPDESQLLAGALTLLHHGHYWGVVDCGSAGPLDMIPLVLPRLLGLPLDYTTARSVGLLLLWGSCVFAWLTVRPIAGDRLARLVIMPMACCLAFTHYSDFVQYSSEQAPIFFSALAVWLALGAFSATGTVISRVRLALAGGVLSLLPLAKLQTAPFTVLVGACALVWIFQQAGSPWRSRFADAGCLAGGAVFSLGLMGLAVARGGGFADFYQTYWLPNLNYAQARDYPWAEFGDRLVSLVRLVWGFDYFIVPALVLVAIGLAGWPRLPRPARRPVVFGALLFLAGFFVVAAPGRAFQHYLQFLIHPTSLFIGLLFAGLAGGTSATLGRSLWLAIVLLLGVGPQVYYRSHDGNPFHGHLREARANAVGAVARHILLYARPGDTMTVWAWMPTFHVQTQLPQGTRDAHAERQISANLLQAYFRQRYFSELEKNRPAIFVDAVGEKNFGYHNRGVNTHESIPWLGEFIGTNYVFAADIETSRVYVRKDRWRELHP